MTVDEPKTVDFVVRLVGGGVKPWKVPMRALSRLMEAVQRLVEQSEEDEMEVVPLDSENQEDQQLLSLGSPVLKLVGIRAASAGYAIATPFKESAISLLSETGRAIEDPSHSEWSAATLASLKDVSEIAKALGVKVEIRTPSRKGRLGDVIAKITPTTYQNVAGSAFVIGQTSLYGTIERIGGASAARCAIRLPGESKLVYCSVGSDDLAKKLGIYLYQNVEIHGVAKWLRANWRIVSFQITSFESPKEGSFQDALNDIWKAGGKAWDKIEDPNAFLADMRGT